VFLVRTRKAAALARPNSLGNRLDGAALHTTVNAKARPARRRKHERLPARPRRDF
jgi:hypothetical protein